MRWVDGSPAQKPPTQKRRKEPLLSRNDLKVCLVVLVNGGFMLITIKTLENLLELYMYSLNLSIWLPFSYNISCVSKVLNPKTSRYQKRPKIRMSRLQFFPFTTHNPNSSPNDEAGTGGPVFSCRSRRTSNANQALPHKKAERDLFLKTTNRVSMEVSR